MQAIYKVPGYILCLLGGFFLSWGGLIIRNFETHDVWQILFWRAFFMTLTIATFLILIYKRQTINVIKKAGFPGLIGGFIFSTSFAAYIISISQSTVANVLFIISTQTIWLALFGYIFLKEKISLRTFLSILLAMLGIFIGAAQTSDMRNAMLASVAFFILSSELLINIFTNHGLWLSFLLFLIIRSITLNYYFKNILKNF